MRILDIPAKKLCNNHLLGEHRELHAIWSIITNKKKGYCNHPETLRWRGKLKALHIRHEKLVEEMQIRKFNHKSPLDEKLAIGQQIQDEFVDSYKKQIMLIKKKKCNCKI